MNRNLRSRSGDAWCSSDKPPLPQREATLLAGSAVFTSPHIAAASDIAWSSTFAYGRDMYGNLALSLKFHPLFLYLGADLLGDRYVDRDGKIADGLFRLSSRVEYRFPRQALLRFNFLLRSPALGDAPDRLELDGRYQFPSLSRNAPSWGFSRLSLGYQRSASEPEGIGGPSIDSFSGGMAFITGPLRPALSWKVQSLSGAGDSTFEALDLSAQVSWPLRQWQIRAGLGYAQERDKTGIWEGTLSAAYRWSWGRVSAKLGFSSKEGSPFTYEMTVTHQWGS
jgi:hypothetical protein